MTVLCRRHSSKRPKSRAFTRVQGREALRFEIGRSVPATPCVSQRKRKDRKARRGAQRCGLVATAFEL